MVTTASRRVLLIEDDPTLGPAMLQRLKLEGYDARLVADGRSAVREAQMRTPDLVLSDMRLPDISGEAVFRQVTASVGLLPYHFMTAFGDVEQAVRLIKAGARDYLIKPIDVDALIDAIADRPSAETSSEVQQLELSHAMQVFDAQLTKAARSDLPLLIAGETGVGKERAAGLAHARSHRQGSPFVAINCGSIPRELAESMLFGHEKGAFTGALTRMQGVCEEVGAGTLLLDEIAELPLDLQPKLLRLLEQKSFRPVGSSGEKAFRGRVIAATHRDLKERVAEGAFREDLYFRLAVIDLRIPALRERREEIVALAHVLLNDAQARGIGGHVGRPFAFTDAALLAMRTYGWPGNVRELRNRIERAMALADTADLTQTDLFPDRNPPASADQALAPLDKAAEEAIRERVLEALRQCGGNQSNAAKLLGVSRTTIWKYGRK